MNAIQIGAFEAKTKFAELLARVARGQEFLITKRGRPVARLTGQDKAENLPRTAKPTAWELFQRIRKGGRAVSASQLDALVRESRRELADSPRTRQG